MQIVIALVILGVLYAMIIRTPAVIQRMEAAERQDGKKAVQPKKKKG